MRLGSLGGPCLCLVQGGIARYGVLKVIDKHDWSLGLLLWWTCRGHSLPIASGGGGASFALRGGDTLSVPGDMLYKVTPCGGLRCGAGPPLSSGTGHPRRSWRGTAILAGKVSQWYFFNLASRSMDRPFGMVICGDGCSQYRGFANPWEWQEEMAPRELGRSFSLCLPLQGSEMSLTCAAGVWW